MSTQGNPERISDSKIIKNMSSMTNDVSEEMHFLWSMNLPQNIKKTMCASIFYI